MSIIKNTLATILFFLFFNIANAEDNLKSIGKFKDWESFVLKQDGNKVCFAQSIPVLRAPKKLQRDPSRLFVSFRPNEDIQNEISVTNGYQFKLKTPVKAKTGRKSYDLFSEGRFAWIKEDKEVFKLINDFQRINNKEVKNIFFYDERDDLINLLDQELENIAEKIY